MESLLACDRVEPSWPWAVATVVRRSPWRRPSSAKLLCSMCLTSLVAVLTCLALVLCAADSADASKPKIAQLKALEKNGIVELNESSFEEYVSDPARQYGFLVLFTAMSPEHGCMPCREIDPEFRLLANSLSKQRKDDGLFVGVLEFQRGVEVFRKLKMTSAPTIIYIPPTIGQLNADRIVYDLHRRGFGVDALADWLSQLIGRKVNVIRPMNWSRIAALLIGSLFTALVGKVVLTRYGHLLRLTGLWGAVTLVVILMMCSGHMWNHIRKPPYVAIDRDGKMSWISPGFQQQFVLESQVSAMLQAVAAFSVVALAVRVPRLKDPAVASLVALTTTAVLMFDVSALLWLFRQKNGGYPFKLFF